MSQTVCDFRSDTITRPGAAMRAAMANAEVGDDVFADDPTVKALEARLAEMVGKEAGLYVPSGTQSNLIALMIHCGRGDEFIAGQEAHLYKYEAGGAAVLGSIQPQPLENLPDGSIAIDKIAAAIKPDDMHFARTKLLALENTIGGKVVPQDYIEEATALAHARGLATHLDGARLFNATVKSNRSAAELVAPFDSVSVCLSKGLGAPVGSVLAGSADFIAAALRQRKMLGGGMRQAGVIAAAGLYALEHNVARLAEDHRRAARLAEGFAGISGVTVAPVQTNMVFMEISAAEGEALIAFLAERGVLVTGRYGQLRWVTHLDVDDTAVETAITAVAAYFEGR